MSEATAVQNPMIKYADPIDWQRVSRKEALYSPGLNLGIVDETAVNNFSHQLTLWNMVY